MKLACFALCMVTAFAQLPPKQNSTIKLENTPTAGTVKQMISMVKTVADVLDVSFDENQASFSMRAPGNQLNLAAWLLHAADKPGNWQPVVSGSAASDYRLQPGDDPTEDRLPLTRIHYLRNSTSRDAIEILTVIRMVAQIQRVTATDEPHMIAMRGAPANIDLGDWIIQKLDLPATANVPVLQTVDPNANTFKLPPQPDGAEDITKVFYLNPKTRPADAVNLAKKIRQETNTVTVFSKTSPPAIVVRGNSLVLAQAQQIM